MSNFKTDQLSRFNLQYSIQKLFKKLFFLFFVHLWYAGLISSLIPLSSPSQVPNNLHIQEIDNVEDRLSLFEVALFNN